MGFGQLPCIKCGEEATIWFALDDCDLMRCAECESKFTREEVANVLDKWRQVLAWLGTAPSQPE